MAFLQITFSGEGTVTNIDISNVDDHDHDSKDEDKKEV
jgi:hypothetical protein